MSSSAGSARGADVSRDRAPIQTITMIIGAVFLLIGILGFVPGITTNYDQLGFATHHSEARLLGVFQVSVLHNIVHLLFGIAAFAMARTASGARAFLIGSGVIYLILWIYGLIIPFDSAANFVPLNPADNWLHLVLGVGLLALGLALGRSAAARTDTTTRRA